MTRTTISSFFSFILFYLGASYFKDCSKIDSELDLILCHFNNYVYDEKSIIAVIILFLLILINHLLDRKVKNRINNNIHDILDVFLDTRLANNKEAHRITIFQRVSFFKAFIYYLKTTFLNLLIYWKKNKLSQRLKMMPLPFNSYLIVYSRCGQPNQHRKSTIIKINKDSSKTNSFAEYCFHSGQIKHISLPKIYDQDFLNVRNIDDLTKEIKAKVKNYMTKSKVENFSHLRMFSRTPPFIGAIPLYVKKRSMHSPSHIIVFDSLEMEYAEVSKQLERLSKYIEAILINK